MPYPAGQFLNSIEVKLIQRDYECLLATSCHATTITGEYKTPVNPVVDQVYGITDADSWSVTHFTGKALQQIVLKEDERLLSFGILEVGDAIFYLSTFIDLSQGYDQTFEIIDPDGTRWIPIPRKHPLQRYLLHRIAQTQVGQVVPAKIKK